MFQSDMLECVCISAMRLQSSADRIWGRHLNCTILVKGVPPPVPFPAIGQTLTWWTVVLLLVVALTWWSILVVRLFCTTNFRAVVTPLIDPCKLWGRMQRPEQQDPVISKLFLKKRLQRMHKGTTVIAYWFMPTLAMIWLFSVNDILTAPTPEDRGYLLYNRIFESATFSGFLAGIAGLAFKTFPRTLTLRSGDVISMFLFVVIGLQSACMQHDMNLLWFKRWATMGQILLTLFCASARTVFWPNMVSVLWNVFVVYADGTLRLKAGWHTWNCVAEATTVYTVAWYTEEWLWSEVTAKANEMRTSKAEAIAQSLLSMLCDAVVPLGSDLSLCESCPRFTAMLFRDRKDGGLREPFINFCNEADKPRFLEFMAEPSTMPGKSKSLHVHLMDSVGNAVPVQLFCTSLLQDQDDDETEYLHLLGITEDKESGGIHMFPRSSAPVQIRVEDEKSPDQVSLSGDTASEQSPRSNRGASSAARSDAGSSVFGWSRPAFCSFQAELSLQLVQECDECAALFAFSHGDKSLLSRIQEPGFWIWLQQFHLKARTSKKSKRESTYGEIEICSSSGVKYKVVATACVGDMEEKDNRLISQLFVKLLPPGLPKNLSDAEVLRVARRDSVEKRQRLMERARSQDDRQDFESEDGGLKREAMRMLSI